MLLKIKHRSHYRFDRPVPYGLQRLRLIPKENAAQSVLRWDMAIEGGKVEAAYTDLHNNQVWLVSIDADSREIAITSDGEVKTTDTAGVLGRHGGHVPLWYFQRPTALTKASPEIQALARSVDGADQVPLAMLHRLSANVLKAVHYDIGYTNSATTAEAALNAGHGVCQDHAQIFISAARLLGFPARYVSGYLMLTDQIDQEASHAWAEAHIDGLGWVGFDISNGISPDTRYVRIATGADFTEAAPVSGMSYGGGDHSVVVSLSIQQ
jgi:transglutaminase-like putative cysteine protease